MEDEICQDCRKPISRRARANMWNGERIICTSCLHERENAAIRQEALYRIAGKPNTPWMAHDGKQQYGPFSTKEMIANLQAGRIKWEWSIWREAMASWVPASRLFTIPELSEGRLELRKFGQGDGTYYPSYGTNPPH